MSLALKIFNSLHGSWRIHRKIAGAGYLDGYAQFNKNPNNTNELFYQENGIFFFEDGKSFEASKRYIYSILNDDIYVYFNDKSDGDVENDANKRRLFHTFGISKTQLRQDQNSLIVEALHLCIDDKYQVKYEFKFNNLNKFLIIYDVKGPKKNYVSETSFEKIQDHIL